MVDSNQSENDVNEFWNKAHGAHQVLVKVMVNTISNTETAKETFSCNFTVEQQWMMSKTDLDKDKPTDWKPPKMNFPYAESPTITDRPFKKIIIGKMRNWILVSDIQATFKETFKFENYPFDSQDFCIHISWPESSESLLIWPHPDGDFLSFKKECVFLRGWKMFLTAVEFNFDEKGILDKQFQHNIESEPTMLIHVKAERKALPYWLNEYSMMALVALSSLASFMPDIEEGGSRVAYALTALLTVTVYQQSRATKIPKLDYLTVGDKYNFFYILFTVAILVEVAIEALLTTHLDVSISKETDMIILLLNCLILIVSNICILCYLILSVFPDREKNIYSVVTKHGINMDDVGLKNNFEYSISSDHTLCVKDGHHIFTSLKNNAFSEDTKMLCGIYTGDYSFKVDDIFYKRIEHINVFMSYNVKNSKYTLVGKKISGDKNVPAGSVTFIIYGLPKINDVTELDLQITLREDASNVKDFKVEKFKCNITTTINEDDIQMKLDVGSINLVFKKQKKN